MNHLLNVLLRFFRPRLDAAGGHHGNDQSHWTSRRKVALLSPLRTDKTYRDMGDLMIKLLSGGNIVSDIFALVPGIMALVEGILDKDESVTDEELIEQVDNLVQLQGVAEMVSDLVIRGAVLLARAIKNLKNKRSK